jgi:S1-C subfamily serine protease
MFRSEVLMDIKTLSDSLANAVERAAESVLRVEGRRRGSTGLAWSADGQVLTAAHTLHHEESVRIGLPDGRSVSAKVLGRDPGTDLALVKVDATLVVPAWREEGGKRVGELVVALGRAGGGVRASFGMVAGVNGPWRTAGGGRVDRWIEVDGALPPGFSGGPLIDVEGGVIGLNTSALSRGGGTLPVTTLRRIAQSLAEHGGVRRGWLGLGVQPVQLDGAQAQAAGQDRGLLVISLSTEGPAAKAGLLVGDILLSYGGAPLGSAGDLHAKLDESAVDQAVSLRILQGGTPQDVAVIVGGRVAREAHGCCR